MEARLLLKIESYTPSAFSILSNNNLISDLCIVPPSGNAHSASAVPASTFNAPLQPPGAQAPPGVASGNFTPDQPEVSLVNSPLTTPSRFSRRAHGSKGKRLLKYFMITEKLAIYSVVQLHFTYIKGERGKLVAKKVKFL